MSELESEEGRYLYWECGVTIICVFWSVAPRYMWHWAGTHHWLSDKLFKLSNSHNTFIVTDFKIENEFGNLLNLQNKVCHLMQNKSKNSVSKLGQDILTIWYSWVFCSTQFELPLLAVCVTWEGEKYVDKRIQLCWCVVWGTAVFYVTEARDEADM